MEKILLLVPSMTSAGGTERMVSSLSILLKRAGYIVFLAVFDGLGDRIYFKSEVPLYPLGPIPCLPLPLRPFNYFLSAWRLARLKRRLKVDITISNLWRADFISQLSGGSDKKIALCHTNVVGNPTNRLMLKMLLLVAKVYRRFDKLIAVSAPLADELRNFYGLKNEQIGFINNFVDRPKAITCLPSDGICRFVWCGRLVIEKNVSGLLHLWSRFVRMKPHIQLIIIGDGPMRGDLEALGVSLGLRIGYKIGDSEVDVVMLGSVYNPADYMIGARALILTSIAEGLPMVILEALALGLPVLASDCSSGGVRAAVLGEGFHNPARELSEPTPCGVLLPVPQITKPISLTLWLPWLSKAVTDDVQCLTWQSGALERAIFFSSEVALRDWQKVLKGILR
jgi:N-acetylgalactosamine-N,N'-diacetylbacillosaminyl-diphospho-undecaprenol 4-alpha-N-acetylgalactosaminyltransferase